MGKILGKAQYRDVLLGIGLLWATAALVLWPEQAMEAMRDGIILCGNVILPSLFPFFVLSSLVVELGMSRYLGRLLEPVMASLAEKIEALVARRAGAAVQAGTAAYLPGEGIVLAPKGVPALLEYFCNKGEKQP